jgi:hypothetical protein
MFLLLVAWKAATRAEFLRRRDGPAGAAESLETAAACRSSIGRAIDAMVMCFD